MTFGADVDSAFSVGLYQTTNTTAQSLTFDTDAPGGNASITVASGSTANITIGTVTTATAGSPILNDNLLVDHNGSGVLLFNRPFQAAALSITKTGTGTMQSNNNNLLTGNLTVSGGTFIANTFGDGLDARNFSNINLNGGTFQANTVSGGGNKYYFNQVNVTADSTFSYACLSGNNTFSLTNNGTIPSTLDIATNTNLRLQNVSSNTTTINAFNISRSVSGSGNLTITTYNNITSISDNFGLGRILISGDNSAWNGNLTIDRGTVSLGGNTVNAAGTGVITIGTVADAFGAGLTFFPTGTGGSTVTYPNNIVVTPGGFRAIKGGSTNHNVTFTGNVTLNGNLTVDHSWTTADRRTTLSGNISGSGGLIVTRAGGSLETTLRMAGVNTYLGNTTVTNTASLALASTCSLASSVDVQPGGRIGGPGTIAGNLTLTSNSTSNATFFFYAVGLNATTYVPMTVNGAVTLGGNFSVANIVGGSRGEVVDWANTPDGTYTLITSTPSNLNYIQNFGYANYATIAVSPVRYAYFQGTTGLQLVVSSTVPVAPDPYASWAGNATFTADANNDGVSNGVAWFLGAANVNETANAYFQLNNVNAGALVVAFDCLSGAERGSSVFSVQYGGNISTLASGNQTEVPGTVGTFTAGVVDYEVTPGPGGLLHVVATIPSSEAVASKLFGRIVGQQ
ncbi:MAG: hypothetical protein SFU85_00735 [Candidatus Methylacidiphilales bacterium]|nr:hypothetical protein [Candidatus Methylacidiphilales bacterium]